MMDSYTFALMLSMVEVLAKERPEIIDEIEFGVGHYQGFLTGDMRTGTRNAVAELKIRVHKNE